jgi:predicted phosphoadenosine phosphosulfate sulfurtransferase
MRIYLKNNVFDEALARINRIFDEFPNVVVGFSGGKDSTVTFNLTMQVAKERGRLPQKVLFVDQEAEWQATIDYVKKIMYRDDVEPYWLQVPFKITNSASSQHNELYAWQEGAEWLREKDPISIKENVYNTAKGTTHHNEFYAFFSRFFAYHFKGQPAAYLSGVRAEESPQRATALTNSQTYKDITWGKTLDKSVGHYTFYPLYDWSFTDIWSAIHKNGWDYCKIYDYMYQHGVPVNQMRVSNLHHEQAIKSLFYLPEIEKETYNKLTKRLNGISSANKLGFDNFYPKTLPPMFSSWKEYRDFLLDKIVPAESIDIFKAKFKVMDEKYALMDSWKDTNGSSKSSFAATSQYMNKVCVQAVCINDTDFVKINAWEFHPTVHAFRKAHNIPK